MEDDISAMASTLRSGQKITAIVPSLERDPFRSIYSELTHDHSHTVGIASHGQAGVIGNHFENTMSGLFNSA